ncbi:MAG TPA: phosphoribosylformylglycinamidine cyclo-ligase [Dissulfurispiraceae bacterium]|nr:phosphoribosylformylglycinamidine cyclo-ligase [Dissulfurispiraceae bacterium]
MKPITYKQAGVDIDEGERLVKLISPIVKRTFRKEVLADIGSFGALFRLDLKKYREPVLVSGTDGVGTKLKIAFLTGKYDTVGIDLVAMCVNDILTLGAEPLFFLDYYATGALSAEKARDVVKGIADGCLEAGCSLIGGETAEMPGFYDADEFDLAGFSVGVVDRKNVVDGKSIRPGDAVIGVLSSGLHSNGYSLIRKILFDLKNMTVDTFVPELNQTLGEALLTPTRIYVKGVAAVGRKVKIKGMAHITGGGIPGNLPRILPSGLRASIFRNSWEVPALFSLVQKLGSVPENEMKKTFNMGIGYVIVVSPKDADASVAHLKKSGYPASQIGFIEQGGKQRVRYV